MRSDGPADSPLLRTEREFFAREQELHETKYLAGTNPRQQSGFGRDAHDWERFRRAVVAPIDRDGSFLDVGCANGLLMESVAAWALEDGHRVEPFGLDISEKLAALARRRLPQWRDRVFVGNALFWEPSARFDFVRTELVYVPPSRRREYVDRLLERFVAPGGRLLICSYGSSRPEGGRAEDLVDEIRGWGLPVQRVDDAVSPEHGFVITRVVSVTGGRKSDVHAATQAEVSMNHVGRSFRFDYGDFVVRVRYLSDSRLEWEQTKGPQAGSKGEEEYGHAAIRDEVVFFWWQEKDASVVTQVVDFAKGAVYTTWTSPDRKLSGFQGKVSRLE